MITHRLQIDQGGCMPAPYRVAHMSEIVTPRVGGEPGKAFAVSHWEQQ
jgi:hypothetical protein